MEFCTQYKMTITNIFSEWNRLEKIDTLHNEFGLWTQTQKSVRYKYMHGKRAMGYKNKQSDEF